MKTKYILHALALNLVLTSTVFAAPKANYMKGPDLQKLYTAYVGNKTAVGMSFLTFSWLLLQRRSSEKNFKSRFNAKELLNIRKIASSDYWKNIWYAYYDEFVGQKSKPHTVTIGTPGAEEKLQVRDTSVPAYGFLGNVKSEISNINDAFKGVSSLLSVYVILTQTGLVKYFTKDGQFNSPADNAAAARAQEERDAINNERDDFAAFRNDMLGELRNIAAALNRNPQPVAQAVGSTNNATSQDDLLNNPSSDVE